MMGRSALKPLGPSLEHPALKSQYPHRRLLHHRHCHPSHSKLAAAQPHTSDCRPATPRTPAGWSELWRTPRGTAHTCTTPPYRVGTSSIVHIDHPNRAGRITGTRSRHIPPAPRSGILARRECILIISGCVQRDARKGHEPFLYPVSRRPLLPPPPL
ncbi:hypothetical protein BD779DRAFT_1582601 [Infundibulicybe gibba]|nr:hypothetical protein BD779DRAFT_1582601 [Infundibulicybe gibba]